MTPTDAHVEMRIKHVSWSNFRRLPDGSLTARDHIVLIGPNDTGKSSILRALHMCLGMPYAQLAAAITPRDFTDSTRPIIIKVTLDGIQADDRAAFPDEINTGPPETLEIHLEATLDSADHDQKTVRRIFPDSGHQRAPTKNQLRTIGFAFVPAARSLYRELGGADGTVRSLLSTLDLGSDVAALQAAIADYRNVLDQSETLTEFRGSVATALSSALPTPVATDDVRVISQADMMDDPLSGVTLTVRDGEHDVPVSEQSDGIRALSLLTLLAMSHHSAKIVALDEPETHLHPIAQRAVAQSFQSATSQRIVVTHSPSVVARMRPLDIVTFGADRRARQLKADAEIAAFESTVRYWSYKLIEPLTSRRIVLVEGPSDRILFERIAHLTGADLDRRGIAVFELDSKDQFPFAYKLFGSPGFDLPLAGLLDEDAKESWANELSCAEDDLAARGYFVCNPDLEGAYVQGLSVERVKAILCAAQQIGEQKLLQGCRVSSLAEVEGDHLLAFCRNRKVSAALAVSSVLSGADVDLIAPLASLIRHVS